MNSGAMQSTKSWLVIFAERIAHYSRIYDTLGGASHIGENVGLNYRPRVFIDDVHFTDLGVELVTNQLTKIVGQLQQ